MRRLAIFLLFASSALARGLAWQPATVVGMTSTTENRGNADFPGIGVSGVPIYVTTYWYRIDTDDTSYMLSWNVSPLLNGKHKHPLNLTLHGHTQIALDGSSAHIRDDDGKDVKVPIAQKRAL